MQVNTTEANLFGNGIDAKVGVADVLVDNLHNAIEQLLVRRLHLDLLHLFLELVVTSILQAQHLMGMNKVDDGTTQNIHIERLHHVRIGTHLKAFKLVFIAALGSQQDDGDMTRRGITLNLRTHGVTIHLRHHDVRNHQIRHGTQHL